jgi:Domain of unknown function (DUF6268)
MKKIVLLFALQAVAFCGFGQDTTANEEFDASLYSDQSTVKKYCTQKVLNQTPTKLIGVGWEQNFGFDNTSTDGIGDTKTTFTGMGGLRTNINLLAISTNKIILQLGINSWSSKLNSAISNKAPNAIMQQVYGNRADVEQLSALLFKPLDQKHFIIAQLNADMAYVGKDNNVAFSKDAFTAHGSVIYGWKKSDYLMWGLGVSRTYRLGRPLIVPVFLYNKTFNEHWGIEALLPARAFARYNFSSNSMLLGGVELEGQQFAIENKNAWLQRGEIKPRISWEKKLYKFFWVSSQLGYRINGRYNIVNKYNGGEATEFITNKWGGAPYINISINFVSP